MARGSIRLVQRGGKTLYEVVVDLGPDPSTGNRRQRSKIFKTPRAAERGLTAWQSQIDRGEAVDRSKKTVGDYLRAWMETYPTIKGLRESTIHQYRYAMQDHILPDLGEMPVQKLTRERAQSFVASCIEQHGRWQAIKVHAILKKALDGAVADKLLTTNPLRQVAPPTPARAERKSWTVGEATRFLGILDRCPYGPIFQTAVASGLRRGELLGLRWDDVDTERGVLVVRHAHVRVGGKMKQSDPKTPAGWREASIPPAVVKLLKSWRLLQAQRRLAAASWGDPSLVFSSAVGTVICDGRILRVYRKLVEEAGVPYITIHSLRRTYISTALRGGADVKVVATQVGHKDVKTTLDIYRSVTAGDRALVASTVGDALFAEGAR